MQVDFMIIGAHKSGTTSLAYQLAQHPQISFCREKEPHYFSAHEDWAGQLAEYHHLFEPGVGQLYGEGSTSYTIYPERQQTHSRLHAYNPDLKLIYLMRQPIDRIWSHYTHELIRGGQQQTLDVELLANPSYVNRSRYSMQLKPYLELFGRQQILLLIFEEYINNPLQSLEQVALFLNISPAEFATIDTSPRNMHVSLKKYPAIRFLAQKIFRRLPFTLRHYIQTHLFKKINQKPQISQAVVQSLWQAVEDDVSELEEILARPLDIWRQDPRLS